MTEYNAGEIEKKWQKKWEEEKLYKTLTNSTKPKSYVLDMFPYPSGAGLHAGHTRIYTGSDIYARFKRMNGANVLFATGWDAFGLPAEQYALKHKVHPSLSVKKNTDHFREQMKMLGFSYDWEKEINTTDPKFYKWTQWIFLELFKAGLAYESYEPINWCPSCKTGLANEDLEGGKCERCGSEVLQKPMRQWVLKIREYADRLVDDLEKTKWPESIKELQRNWIGRKEGWEIKFEVKCQKSNVKSNFNFLILHGWTGHAHANFIPWIKNELESRGHKVQVPELPNTDTPSEEEQVSYVLDNCSIDENTIIVGHSLGCAVAMKTLLKLNKPVAGLVLVASVVEPRFRIQKEAPYYWKTFDLHYDYKIIKKLAGFRTVLSDTLEKHERGAYLKYLAEKIDASFYETKAKEEHFTAAKEPFVLEHIMPCIRVFTTCPDTLYGATFMVLAPEHPFIENYKTQITNHKEVEEYINAVKNKTELERIGNKEKTGIELKGVKTINPGNKEEIPIWVSDYVLMQYGTGAIMAVPSHDSRDGEFAEKFGLPKREVSEIHEGVGTLINSGQFNGLPSEDAKQKIAEFVGGEKRVTYKLRDWVFSRQRYWGEPIPLVFCESCKKSAEKSNVKSQMSKVYSKGELLNPGWVPVPEDQLPVTLPDVEYYEPTGTGESPLANIAEWVNTVCPKCGGPAKREINTMPQWAGSSWYYLAYIMQEISDFQFPISQYKEAFAAWLPVDIYVGGLEHATRHLIYARFWHKFLFDKGFVSEEEPFPRLQTVGLVLGEDGAKMSKRLGNVVNPDEMIARFGADAMRLYVMFMGPFEETTPWNTNGLVGTVRFLERVFRQKEKVRKDITDEILMRHLHKLIKKVSSDIETLSFNTAVSAYMIFAQELDKKNEIPNNIYADFLKILAPFAPHAAEELWALLGNKNLIHQESWPEFNEGLIAQERLLIPVQINGKVRDSIEIERALDEDAVVAIALSRDKVQKWLAGKDVKKTIYIKEKMLSLVID